MVLLISIQQQELLDSDESSMSSTYAVENSNCISQNTFPDDIDELQCTAPKKSVRFNLDENVAYESDLISIEERHDIWYNSADYREFKVTAWDCAQQIMKVESTNEAPYSYQRVMERTFNACLSASRSNLSCADDCDVIQDSELIHLQRWLEVATSRWGLEKWSIKELMSDRSARRTDMYRTVRLLQKNFKYMNDDNSMVYSVLKTVLIRKSCESISHSSRIYSRTIGRALEVAVRNENEKENSFQTVSMSTQ